MTPQVQEVREKLHFSWTASEPRMSSASLAHPRILHVVRDRDYDESALNPPSPDPPELNEIYNTNWPLGGIRIF